MLKIQGEVLNVYVSKRGTNREGQEFGGQDKVQLLVDEPAEDGTVKKSVIDLKTEDARIFQSASGKSISVPVGVFAPAKNSIVFYIVGKPVLVSGAPSAATA